MAICLFSLAGIPPLAGFWGKFALFRSALDVGIGQGDLNFWFLTLCIAGVLNAAIAAAYYLKVVANLFFHSTNSSERLPAVGNTGAGMAATVCTAVVLGVGLFSGSTMVTVRESMHDVWATAPTGNVENTLGKTPAPAIQDENSELIGKSIADFRR